MESAVVPLAFDSTAGRSNDAAGCVYKLGMIHFLQGKAQSKGIAAVWSERPAESRGARKEARQPITSLPAKPDGRSDGGLNCSLVQPKSLCTLKAVSGSGCFQSVSPFIGLLTGWLQEDS